MKTNFKKNGGFTLVELIVVIAILAILAAVAIPAYSGYIEKANKAGDEQLLAAVNKAFASACALNGESHIGRDASKTKITMTDVDGGRKVSALVVENTQIAADFAELCEDGVFSVFENLYYNKITGTFSDENTIYANLPSSWSQEDKEAYLNSVYAELGAEALFGKMGELTGFGAALIGANGSSFYELVYGTPGTVTEYMKTLASSLGYSITNADGTINVDEYTEFQKEMATLCGEDGDPNVVFANGAIISAANKTSTLDTAFLSGGNVTETIKGHLNSPETAEQGLAEAAMAYAMYMSYAESEAGKAAGATVPDLNGVEDVSSLVAMLNGMNTTAFQNYMNNTQAQADLKGYQASMNMINSSTEDQDALRNILSNGFNDPALIELLNAIS